MGKTLDTAIAVLIAFMVVGLFANNVLYDASTDVNKTAFIGAYNGSTDAANPMSNFTYLSTDIEEEIASANQGFQSGSVIDTLAAAFGLISSVTIKVGALMLSIVAQSLLSAAGIMANMMTLPAPWNAFGVIGSIAIVCLLVYLVVKVVSVIIGRDI